MANQIPARVIQKWQATYRNFSSPFAYVPIRRKGRKLYRDTCCRCKKNKICVRLGFYPRKGVCLMVFLCKSCIKAESFPSEVK